ncbi:MAG: response regulator [candidate division Zixibacteria bacterium]|nr:response regulator [candidate division Zixibacteria bacterium]
MNAAATGQTLTERSKRTERSTGRILIVDDEPRMTASLRALLSEEGHQTEGALSGEEAITRMQKTAYDVLVVDVRMPGVDGMDVLRAARAQNPDRPVIMMTAYASLESAVSAINEGAYDYLVKPIDLTEMRLTVRRAVEKHRLNLARASLTEELQEKNRTLSRRVVELNALHEVGAALSTTGELDRLLKSILNQAMGVIGTNYGSIMLLNPERETLSVVASSESDVDRFDHVEVAVGDSIAGHVTSTGDPLMIEDVESDPRFRRRNRPQFETKSLICAPLRTPNSILGVINLSDKCDHLPFTREDLRLLVTLAAQAAMAIEDARHFQQVRRQLDEVTALHELTNRLAEVERTDQMVDAVFDTLARLTSGDKVQWWEWRTDREGIALVACRAGTEGKTAVQPLFAAVTQAELMDEGCCGKAVLSQLRTAEPRCSVETVLTVPVRSSEHPLGVFVVGRCRKSTFSDHERHLVGLACSQAERIFERQRALLNATRLVTMGKMISEISHDLRKPLTNIRGSLQVLRGKSGLSAETGGILESADHEIVRLATLVTELVDFANPKRYRTERRDLGPILRRAVSLIDRAATKHGVTVTVDFPERLPSIFCDENQIIEAMLNVLSNAIDAMGKGGSLTVAASVDSAGTDGGQKLVISIRDTGQGMQKSELNRIFERYYTTKASGTGLGLAIVQRIIRAHAGEVRADSIPGKGTTFYLELPVR